MKSSPVHTERKKSRGPDCEESTGIAPRTLNLKRILVPVDFSPASEQALKQAILIAEQFNAKITLLYVSQAQFYGTEFAHMPDPESAISGGCKERLRSFANHNIPPALLEGTMVRSGVPFDEIAKAAKELNAGLIVVNTHGHTGLKHMMLGSTAERVVRYAPCSVLVVRKSES
jgi:nucleotide-binding universal stress UspA family protein